MNAPSLGGILATRQGSLALALVCAICAAGVLVFALGRYKTHVTQPTPEATVLFASGEIAKGTTGTEIAAKKLYELKTEPASQMSAGAITNAADLTNETASADILPGAQLTTSDFSALAAVSLALHNGTRGIEIATSGALGAVDITNPGSRVDIWGKPSSSDTSYVLVASNVLVLKPATPTPVTVGNQSIPGSTLVVEIPDAEVHGVLDSSASVYLTLRPGKSGAVPAAAVAAPTTTTTTTTAGAS